jgi:predicted MFS family arabinose efflux permease
MHKRKGFALTGLEPLMNCPAKTSPAPMVLPSGPMGRAAALWLQASILVTYLAASTAPSPLYALYREAWGFSALTLTVVFATYAFTLLAALLFFGALSDHRGRREVVVVSLLLEAAAILVFRHADSVGWLVLARAVQGVATGIATSALSAGMQDLHRERGALLNSIAPLLGMGVGALGAGALAQFAPAPTRLVYDVLLVVLAAQTLAAFRLPETVSRRAGALAAMRPQLAVPRRARAMLLQVLPVNTAQWALGGFYASLAPSLARIVTGLHSPLLGGGVVATLVLSGAAAVLALRTRPARAVLASGTAALVLGLGVTLAGVQWHSTAAFFAGSAIAGLGFGAAFNGTLRSLVPLAEAHERAGLMSTFFALSYLAFSVPAIVAGLLAGRIGLQAAAMGYGLLLVALAGTALAMMARRRDAA